MAAPNEENILNPFAPKRRNAKEMTPTRGLEPPTEHLRCFCTSIPHNRPRQGRRLGLWFTLREETPTYTPCSLHCAAGKSFSRTTAYHPMSQYHQAGAWLPKFCPRQVKSLRGLGSLGSADVPDLDDRNKPPAS